jgi:hypothetical protein
MRRIVLVILLATASAGLCDEDESPAITSFTGNGALSWSDSQTTGTYRVEWTPSLQEKWRSSWEELTSIPGGSNGVTSAQVPMFYRVVRVEPNSENASGGQILTLDKANPSMELTCSSKDQKSLWATVDGTAYELEIVTTNRNSYRTENGGLGFIIGVGETISLKAKVTPNIPGTYRWSMDGTNFVLESSDSPTVNVRAQSPAKGITFLVSFTPCGPYWGKTLYCVSFDLAHDLAQAPRSRATEEIRRTVSPIVGLTNAVVVGGGKGFVVFESQPAVDAVIKAVESNQLFGKASVEEGSRLKFNHRFHAEPEQKLSSGSSIILP